MARVLQTVKYAPNVTSVRPVPPNRNLVLKGNTVKSVMTWRLTEDLENV